MISLQDNMDGVLAKLKRSDYANMWDRRTFDQFGELMWDYGQSQTDELTGLMGFLIVRGRW